MSAPVEAVLTFRVSMVDVDMHQIHFATYYQWMDRGLQELMAQGRMPVEEMLSGGNGTPVRSVQCEYPSPAALGDRIKLTSSISRTGNTSFDVTHSFRRLADTAEVARATVTHVHVGLRSGRPEPLPEWLLELAGAALDGD